LSKDEAPSVAKVLVEFAKEGPLELKGGIVEGKVFTAEEVEQLSKLPTREELLAKLLGTMNAPMQNLAQVLNAIPSQLVRAVKAVADQKAEQES
jgi:large subunit ribosomal protein L10